MAIYVAKYNPLCATLIGAAAAEARHIKPFVDASCRREPDLEGKYPSVTALCRCGLFAPALHEGDCVVYITFKGLYGETFRHWRITAALKVIARFETHFKAAERYKARKLNLPSNCMVPGNGPKRNDETFGYSGNGCQSAEKEYQDRAKKWPVFLVCRPLWRDLVNPPVIDSKRIKTLFAPADVAGARNPIEISTGALLRVIHWLKSLSP